MIDICFDFETEGLNLATSRPWQLGVITASNGRIIDRDDIYIDIPDLQINQDVIRVTGFSWEKYDKLKQPAESVINFFQNKIDKADRIIAHNGLGYDIYIWAVLNKEYGRDIKFDDIVYKFYDTLSIARAQHFESAPPKDKHQFLSWQYKHLHKFDKSIKTNLAAVAKRNNIEVDDSKTHDALYDVELTYQIFKQMLYSLDLP